MKNHSPAELEACRRACMACPNWDHALPAAIEAFGSASSATPRGRRPGAPWECLPRPLPRSCSSTVREAWQVKLSAGWKVRTGAP
ncbi:hypothetical protein ACPA9J_24415 [Pseudomonas aeruginosa]